MEEIELAKDITNEQLFEFMTKMYSKMQEMKVEVQEMKVEMQEMKGNMATKHDIIILEYKMDTNHKAIYD